MQPGGCFEAFDAGWDGHLAEMVIFLRKARYSRRRLRRRGLGDGGYLGQFCLHNNIRLEIKLVVFSALKLFFILFLYFIQDQ